MDKKQDEFNAILETLMSEPYLVDYHKEERDYPVERKYVMRLFDFFITNFKSKEEIEICASFYKDYLELQVTREKIDLVFHIVMGVIIDIVYAPNNESFFSLYGRNPPIEDPDMLLAIFNVFDNIGLCHSGSTFSLSPRFYEYYINSKNGAIINMLEQQSKRLTENLQQIEIAESSISDIKDRQQKNTIEIISVLTIFTALIVAFLGGFKLFEISFSAINDANYFIIFLLTSIVGFCLYNVIFLLVHLIYKVNKLDSGDGLVKIAIIVDASLGILVVVCIIIFVLSQIFKSLGYTL